MQKAKIFYISISVLCLVIISTSIYYALGGFEPLEIYFFDGTTRAVIGKEYYLPDDKKSYFAKMDSARADMERYSLKGNLAAVIYQNDTIPDDSVLCFIGVYRDDVEGVVRMPSGYEFRQFTTDKIYKLFITQHWLVQPLPDEVEEVMQIKSIEEGELLQPYTFELYYQDGSTSVEKWVH